MWQLTVFLPNEYDGDSDVMLLLCKYVAVAKSLVLTFVPEIYRHLLGDLHQLITQMETGNDSNENARMSKDAAAAKNSDFEWYKSCSNCEL